MIRILNRKEINDIRWDECISNSPDGRIFGYSWYLDQCSEDWFGIVKGDYDAVLPLAVKNKFGFSYCYQPFFTRYFGVYSKQLTSPEERKIFLEAIPHKIKYIDFCLEEGFLEYPSDGKTKKRYFQYIDLNQEYTAIRDRYNENLCRNLRKAEKEELSILPDYNPDEVVDQFKIHQKDKQLGFGDGDFMVLKHLMKDATINAKTLCHAVVSKTGAVLCGAFFMESHNRIIYLKGFSSEEGKKKGAMHFMFDRLIRSKSGLPYILDFGGSSVESVARFYRGFGAKDCLYLHLIINRLPKIVRWLKR